MLNWIKKTLENKWLAWLITIIIFVLCTIPSDEIVKHTKLNDKTAHFVAFGAWAFVWLFAYKNIVKTIILGSLYGVFIECWQYILPEFFHRGFDVLDMIADAIGVIIGVLMAMLSMKILK